MGERPAIVPVGRDSMAKAVSRQPLPRRPIEEFRAADVEHFPAFGVLKHIWRGAEQLFPLDRRQNWAFRQAPETDAQIVANGKAGQ